MFIYIFNIFIFFFRFLLEESKTLKTTVFFSSHNFDGLFEFSTHLLYLTKGRLGCFKAIQDIPEYKP